VRKLLSNLFGSSKALQTIAEGVDKAWFTDQEKSGAFLEYLKASQPQNVSRRVIAVVVVALWVALILLAVATHAFAPLYSRFVFDVLAEHVSTPFAIVLGFYFAAHIVRAAKK